MPHSFYLFYSNFPAFKNIWISFILISFYVFPLFWKLFNFLRLSASNYLLPISSFIRIIITVKYPTILLRILASAYSRYYSTAFILSNEARHANNMLSFAKLCAFINLSQASLSVVYLWFIYLLLHSSRKTTILMQNALQLRISFANAGFIAVICHFNIYIAK